MTQPTPPTPAPPPPTPAPPPVAAGCPAAPGYAAPAPARRPRPAWLLPTITGVAGLVLGLVLGGLGVAAATGGWGHHDGFRPGDGRGYHLPQPRRNLPPGWRPGGPRQPGQPFAPASPSPSAT